MAEAPKTASAVHDNIIMYENRNLRREEKLKRKSSTIIVIGKIKMTITYIQPLVSIQSAFREVLLGYCVSPLSVRYSLDRFSSL